MSKKSRASVLVVTNGYPNPHKPYAAMYLKRHVQLHRESGIHVEVLTTNDSRRGVVRNALKYLLLSWRSLYHLLFTRYDLVHAHWPLPAGLIAAFLSYFKRKPFVLTLHGAYTNDFGNRPAIVQALVRGVIAQADRVIAVGTDHSRKVQTLFSLPDGKLHTIDMGVWMPRETPSKSEARTRLGITPNEAMILFVGNLNRIKGVDILLRALPLLLQHGDTFKLYIGGQGPEEDEIKRLIVELELQKYVKLLGPVLPDDLPCWFAAADICVVPSRIEAFGLVAVEAMACKTAVIASDIGGLRQTIQHGENGLLFPPEDEATLAKSLDALLSNAEQRSRIAEAGYSIASRYDMRNKAKCVLDVYLQLLENRSTQ